MTVLDCSLRLGNLLRKTEEGTRLLEIKSSIEEKYKGNSAYNQYEQFAEKKTSEYYFFAWDVSHQSFMNVLQDEKMEHRAIFLPTAELISSDESIKEMANEAVSFGNVFEKLVSAIISGGKYEDIIPTSWKYKIRTAISDIQIAVERTLLPRTIALYYQRNRNLLDNEATKRYLSKREDKTLLPFSQKALELMAATKDVPEEEKILYEKMYLIIEAVKKGIFYGFWRMVNEITKDQLLECEGLKGAPMREVLFEHQNNCSSFSGKGWLYKIQLEDKQVFLMAHKKTVHLEKEEGKSIVYGIVYPANDRGLFEGEVNKDISTTL